jgi:hypothetical protein
MRVTVQHEICVGIGEAREQRTAGVNINAAWLPRGRLNQQEALAAKRQGAPVRLRGEPGRQFRVGAVAGAGARAMRAEEALLVISDVHLCASPTQQRDDVVRKAVFINTVAETD